MEYIDGMKLRAVRLDDDFYDARPRMNCDEFDEFGRAAMSDFVRRMSRPDISIDKPINVTAEAVPSEAVEQ